MDNRNRDKMSKDDSSQFGSKIGQSEGLGSSSGRTGGSSEIGSSSSSSPSSGSSSNSWQGSSKRGSTSSESDVSGSSDRGSSSGNSGRR